MTSEASATSLALPTTSALALLYLSHFARSISVTVETLKPLRPRLLKRQSPESREMAVKSV